MGDNEGGLVASVMEKLAIELFFGNGVQGSGGFVNDNNVGFFVPIGAGNGYLLTLPPGKLDAVKFPNVGDGSSCS